MNFMDTIKPQKQARLRYGDGEYHILQQGEYVLCGVTGVVIRLDDLKYWNVEKQIAYRTAAIAFEDMAAKA